MDDVKLKDFSTDSFGATEAVRFERSGFITNNVIIRNSYIRPHYRREKPREVEVNSITFDNTTFRPAPRNPFINLAVRTHAVFKNLNLEICGSVLPQEGGQQLKFDRVKSKLISQSH